MIGGLVFCLGLAIGSFLNVVIYRLPRGESLVRPRSACPTCGRTLAAYDLVPVLSFIFLWGKCRHCRAPISWRYPVVELLTGFSFFFLWRRFGLSADFFFFAVYASLLIAIAGIDLDHMIIPDLLSLPGLGLGILCGLFRRDAFFSLLGAAMGGGLLLLVYFAALFFLKKEGLGLGDAKLITMIGAFLGWQGALLTILVGSMLGSFVGIVLLALGRLKRDQPMPFGPFLALAGLLLAFWPWESWLGSWFGLVR
ncbi:MAG: prepilin peptidase [Bacillota bacterium]